MAAGRLQTQTEVFWRDEYEVSQGDLDLVAATILEAGSPQDVNTLVNAVMLRRIQREKDAVAQHARSGLVYRVAGHYEVGQQLVFTGQDFAVGRVLAVRPGHNPRYEPFSVIRVSFEDGGPEREFAADLDIPHPLNRPAEELLGVSDDSVNDAELVEAFHPLVRAKLEERLRASEDYVPFDGMWFLRELLPEIHVGHLNLAEAMIYEAGHPLPGREMLDELDLPTGGSRGAQLFALNHALLQDERFDNVSTGDEPVWYLRALQPAAAFALPAVLRPAFRATGSEYLGLTMLDVVDQIGDELDEISGMLLHQTTDFTFEVSFPHLYAGTMPYSLRMEHLLPPSKGSRFPITLVEAGKGDRWSGWVVPEHRYVAGLGEWYEKTEMVVGGQVSLRALDEPYTFEISAAAVPARSRRTDWTRSAQVSEGQLVLQISRAAVHVRADRNMLIDVPNREEIAALMASAEEAKLSLSSIMMTVFDELAKLSNRGLVHAKTLYSGVNLVRRSGAVPVFAELTRRACFDPVGDGFWAYDASLERVTYQTPDEMRERPQSTRSDTVKDPVVQFLGR